MLNRPTVRSLACSLLIAGCLLGGAAAARAAEPSPPAGVPSASAAGHIVRKSKLQMGTWVEIVTWVEDGSGKNDRDVEKLLELGFDEIARLEKLMSPYIDTSDVSRVNQAAGQGPVEVSPETLEVVEMAQKIARLSGGKFDITFAAMKGLWKFDDGVLARVPDPAEVKARLKLVDYRKVTIDRRGKRIGVGKGQSIDLGGIAKGYAADKAGEALLKAGLKSFMVQAGGDLLARGTKSGQPWMIGIRDPRGPRGRFFAAAPVIDHSFSTSGDYERYFMHNGKRYHHIIDPQTGFPSRGARSVTLYAKDAFTADALDTTVLMLGPEKGLRLLKQFPGVGAVIVDTENKVHVTPNLKPILVFVGKPTDGE
jgi:thiamine biosynthesis lipoprotein